jgi:hypothetical protein
MIPFEENLIAKTIFTNFREILRFQQDIVSMAKKHTTIWGKKSSPNVKFI